MKPLHNKGSEVTTFKTYSPSKVLTLYLLRLGVRMPLYEFGEGEKHPSLDSGCRMHAVVPEEYADQQGLDLGKVLELLLSWVCR